MARLLVATDLTSMGQRSLAERLAAQARADGHDAVVVDGDPMSACKDADGALCLIDGSSPNAMPIAVAACAHALGLPTLALHTHALPGSLGSLFTQAQAVMREEDLVRALIPFYAHVRPFAGKLVRDQVPRLVREAGHQVSFREAAPEERAHYLKRKVLDEAQELLEADPGAEREEVADLLEALETLLRVRGLDRQDLKLVKEAKRKRRGGFERFLIVESATTVSTTPLPPAEPAWPAEERPTRRAPEPVAEPMDEPYEEPVAQEPSREPIAFPPFEPVPDEPMPARARVREPEPDSEIPAFQFPDLDAIAAAPEPEPMRPTRQFRPPMARDEAEPSFQFPPAFTEPEPARTVPATQPEVGLPSWLSTPPTPAAQTYAEPAAPAFVPPVIPSFRVQAPPPQRNNQAKLWNLGAKGEKLDIPDVEEDPDRIDPRVRDV